MDGQVCSTSPVKGEVYYYVNKKEAFVYLG